MNKKKIIIGALCGLIICSKVCTINALEEKADTNVNSNFLDINLNPDKKIKITEKDIVFMNPQRKNEERTGLQKPIMQELDLPNIDDGNSDTLIKIYNPLEICTNLKEAEKKVGFKITVPNLKEYNDKRFYALTNKTLQIDYFKGEDRITVRKAKGNEDISGDYKYYKITKITKVNGMKVTIKSNEKNKANIALWNKGKFTYSITTSKVKGMKEAYIINMIKGIK